MNKILTPDKLTILNKQYEMVSRILADKYNQML